MRSTRATLISGYEAMLHARLLLEHGPSIEHTILTESTTLLPAALQEWGTEASQVSNHFETHRANALKVNGGKDWYALSPLYDEAALKEAFTQLDAPFYIASSKKASRVVGLVNYHFSHLTLDENSPQLFAGLIPPNEQKAEALRTIMARPVAAADPSTTLHFIDDRLETLKYLASQPDIMKRYKLYLATWGYCTPEELDEVGMLDGIRPITLPNFIELLKWGLIAHVDDGCEPEEYEKRQALME